MVYFYMFGLIFITVVSLILSILGFAGKDVILDDAYIKASKEEREKMNKKAYRLQGAIIFLFIFIMTLFNLLRAVLHEAVFTYIAFTVAAMGIVYAIISHYQIKKNSM